MPKSDLKKILNDFKEKRPLYEEFCLAVYKLLDSMLADEDYKYQIFYRIKDLDKLEEKIIRKEKEGTIYKKLEDLEDLAGLRILFYLESDKNKFVEKLLAKLTGEVIVKEHKKSSGYEATHIITSFDKKRISLSEYSKFEGLKCEIQLTSILHHAWSEIEHDMIYKDAFSIAEKDKRKSNFIRKEMKKILSEYLVKASAELDRLVKKVRK
ncbi:MAG: RelA/SpoT domain-containing protein [Candidatus Moranbacteria bacterium]|jgi:ppGpp synthetase/RelA/SpoT-type nucleotidyltranferase|nr:RelA/SpoT domain-containing protein [Candidatus Moranbacteria bacterium]